MHVPGSYKLSVGMIAALVAAVIVAPAATAAPAHAPRSVGRSGFQYYLSLGDSLGFGYSQANMVQFLQDQQPADFAGYTQDLADELDLGAATTNLSCPEETTATMIVGPCPVATTFPGWPYGATAQLTMAQQTLAQHAGQRGLITVSEGSNDLLGVIANAPACLTNPTCPQMGATLRTVGTNLTTIVRTLHRSAPRATIVLLAPYNPYGHAQPVSNLAVVALDFTIALVGLFNGARVADAFVPINGRYATTFDCGNLVYYCEDPNVTTDPFPTDIHPTSAGYGVIATSFEKALG